MSTLMSYLCQGYECDERGCEREAHGSWHTEELWLRDAVERGWTVWSFHAGLRVYCPDHRPKPGHRMLEITDRYRGGA